MAWIQHDNNRHDLLQTVLTNIRLTFLAPEFLVKQVSANELIRQSLVCRDLVDEVKDFYVLMSCKTTDVRQQATKTAKPLQRAGFPSKHFRVTRYSLKTLGALVFRYVRAWWNQ